jgi:Glycosyl hydrolases family 2, sugar binding domain/Glycosyl hydrolases family 2, TIM barrel domain/Glycosyl hydrolases family 2
LTNLINIPRPEHPRPDFMRDTWQNLNGEWDFAFDKKDVGLDEKWFEQGSLSDTITVPYPVESELSGVNNKLPPKVCWYLRTFDLGDKVKGEGRLLLHFGAVDYQTTVWLNGKKLGEHIGGYTPFPFDITDAAKESGNILVVRVFDSLDRMQVRGKQSPKGKPYLIMYTTVTGIWQTVWVERVGESYIKSFTFTPSKDLDGGQFKLETSKEMSGEIIVSEPSGKQIWEGKIPDGLWKGQDIKPWSPDNPSLYDVSFILRDENGEVIDSVNSYVGVRTIEAKDAKIYLNGKQFYQKLLLDQGYFPGGVYTPADDAIMRADVEMYKKMGFNGLRKHEKVEDPRFLYWCDKLGLVVWEEMPTVGFGLPRRVPTWAMERFDSEWLDVIKRDYNHPSIITWTVFNESWGVYEMLWRKEAKKWGYGAIKKTRAADPTRLVVDNSGGMHFDTDVWDFHHYLSTVEKSKKLYEQLNLKPKDHLGLMTFVMKFLVLELIFPLFLPGEDYKGEPILLSEYGGFGFYRTRGGKSLLDQYKEYTLMIGQYPHINGFCYTQPYDVEQEKNGIMSFDREPKVAPEKIKEINDMVNP